MIIRREAVIAALHRAGRPDLADKAAQRLPMEIDINTWSATLQDLGVDPSSRAGGGIPAVIPGFIGNTDGA